MKTFMRFIVFLIVFFTFVFILIMSKDSFYKNFFNKLAGLEMNDNNYSVSFGYTSKMIKNENGYVIQLKDIVAGSAGSDNKRFVMDISIIPSNKQSANIITEDMDGIVAIIKNTLIYFSYEDVKDKEGKDFLKNIVLDNIAKRIGPQKIQYLYFDNLVYN